MAVANLNARVRRGGVSARELLMQHDQFTNDQRPLDDHKVILEQHRRRVQSSSDEASCCCACGSGRYRVPI